MKELFIGIISLFIFVGCGLSDIDRVKDISSDAHHIGKIAEKDEENNTILVEEIIKHNDEELGAMWLRITSKTEILDIDEKEINFSELKEGQLVEAWNDGGIRESQPGRSSAVKIKLIP